MEELERIEMCLYECKRIKEDIEKEIVSTKLMGKTYDAYLSVRKRQLEQIDAICQQLKKL